MPPGSPVSITIFGGPPNDQMTGPDLTASPGPYIAVKITGAITLKLGGATLFTMTGTIGFIVSTSLVRIQGAISAAIPVIGGVSGSIDFAFYSHYMDGTVDRGPGLIGRATLTRSAGGGGGIPGFAMNGAILLE